jgi:tetratricopeptide (TPR) repeat protein
MDMSAVKKAPGNMPVSQPSSRPDGAVGYKRPPVNDRFKPGKSGNPKGRPKGRKNVANVIKDLFNASVAVRAGDKTLHMPTCEAIVRVSVNKAVSGDARSLFAVMDLLEMTGRMNEISEEEKLKRRLKLPATITSEEFDLLRAPAREKDRQRYLAVPEVPDDATSTAEIIPPAIKAGDELVAQGKNEEAFATYRRHLAICKTQITDDKINKQARVEFIRTVGRLGLLADELLLAGNFEQALECAGKAISAATDPAWIEIDRAARVLDVTYFLANPSATDPLWMEVIRAHTLMFLGDVDGARAFFLQFQSDKRGLFTSWETVILREFAQLRKAGHSHSLMAEIENRFAQEGWTTEAGNKRLLRPVMNGEDSVFIHTHPDEIRSGDLLAEQGKLDEATDIYRRNIEKCKTKLKTGGSNAEWKANLQIAVGRLELTARKFLHAGAFGRALECAEDAIAITPANLVPHAIRAHTLMFLDRNDEARALFIQHRGKTIEGKRWEQAILEGFDEQRRAGRSRPLMDEIEKQFAAGGWMAQTTAKNTPPASSPNGASVFALTQSSDIKSGDVLADQGKLDEALAVYRRCLDICTAKIASGQVNIRAIEDRTVVIEKIYGLAGDFLMSRDFAKALEAVDSALSATPHAPWLNVYRAHGLMFLDRVEEAKQLYLVLRSEKVDAERYGASLILQDFAAMRKAHLTHPLMAEIEKLFVASQ